MRLTITRLHLVNFKGQRDLEINFNPYPEMTNISADNGRGKSTVPAAFSWLFTGKDQFDQADINKIKTWDKNNHHIEKINHSVEVDILIDEHQQLTLKRVLVQNWVKRRGETETVLDGHKTEYYINGVGCGTETAFKNELNKLFDERTFKLLTNPLYFNEILDWKERREILFAIAPPVTDSEIISSITNEKNEKRIKELIGVLNAGASFDRYKKELLARKKQKNEQLTLIPAKIEATERTKPEAPDDGFASVESQAKKLQKELTAIDAEIADASKANESLLAEKRENQSFIHNLKQKLEDARSEARRAHEKERDSILDEQSRIESRLNAEKRKLNTLDAEFKANSEEINQLRKKKEFAEKRRPELEEQRTKLLAKFYDVDGSRFHFDPSECKCPTCQTPLLGENLEAKRAELEENFNTEKSKKLDSIEFSGKAIKADIEKYEEILKNFEDKVSDLENRNINIASQQETVKEDITSIQEELTKVGIQIQSFDAATRTESKDEIKIQEQIHEAEKEKAEEADPPTNTSLIEKKEQVTKELDGLKSILFRKEQIEKANKLISEYNEEMRKISQEVADIEHDEDIMNEFNRTRIESIEKRVNDMFQLVSFKLFEVKLNGEEKECCEAIEPNGTPVRDTNTAMKINCGLDIINVLSKHFDRSLPIFIDNRESVSEIIQTGSQITNLIKITGQQFLKVE